jgi:hypothetical protein
VNAQDRPSGASPASETERFVRLSVNLTPEIADVLKEIAARNGISVTEAVRRAIGILRYVEDAQNRGATLLLEENGSSRELVFMT